MLCSLCKAGRIKEAFKVADGIVDWDREIPGTCDNCLKKIRQCRFGNEVDA